MEFEHYAFYMQPLSYDFELDDAQPGEIVQCGTCQSPVAVPDSPTSPGDFR